MEEVEVDEKDIDYLPEDDELGLRGKDERAKQRFGMGFSRLFTKFWDGLVKLAIESAEINILHRSTDDVPFIFHKKVTTA